MKEVARLIELEQKIGDGYGPARVAHQTSLSAGFDLEAAEEALLAPGEWKAIDTGLRIKSARTVDMELAGGAILQLVPELQIRPRSGLASKNGVTVLNSPGTVDADYRGPIKVLLINHSTIPFEIKKGDRIAQGVVSLVLHGSAMVRDVTRGDGGFQSTGK